jgi:rhamnosyltransferase
MPEPQVHCVVVTYRPRERVLRAVLDSIGGQATQVIVVDNTESTEPPADVAPARYVPLGRNMGIAAAQNHGIALALADGADYIWLSDQDTIYPPDFVRRMLAAAATCTAQGIRFAAVAPAFFDTLAGQVRPFIRHAPFIQGFAPVPGPNAVADAIASGTLIPADVLRSVGLMQEDLFIDWVDLEWCWRARNVHGLQVIGVGDVMIQHTLGDGVVRLGRRKITLRTPFRQYYITRNAIYLALYSGAATLPIRLHIAVRALLWMVLYPLVVPDRKWEHLRAGWRGVLDGLGRRMGQRA